MATELLKEKFGISKQSLRNCILSYNIFLLPLNNIPKSNIPTYEAVEKILRQLESQKENIGQQRIIAKQILSKFPTDVIAWVSIDQTQ